MSDYKQIEKKWQQKWEETGVNKFNKENVDKKLYCLEMFSYPSGAKLHIGHWYNYGPADSWARMKKMQGYEVFQPMGFDAFGLPAENYAIKTGIHPHDSTMKNIETMEGQLKGIGATFDWDHEVVTCQPDYYKWTQWVFLQLYKAGLAYRKAAPVNWCSSCKTVLANEQVINGECERCSTEVTKKNLTQWFFKITDYAEELLQKIDELDWPTKTKLIQKNWIGKSEGAEVDFKLEDQDINLRVFTTRVDTLYGVTYIVLAPENEIVDKITKEDCKKAVEEYKENAKKQSEIERMSTTREKTGVFTGSYAVHPLTGEKVPVWVADYVLATYGTGCVMAVPAHDERDYVFANKYNLPIKVVIESKEKNDILPYVEYGTLVNSERFSELTTEKAREEIVKELEKDTRGSKKINYRLRDWLVSRQRYWGAPIPVIHCEHCGVVPVDEKDLPVLLPYDVEFTPDGESPLKKSAEFMNVKCPKCGADAKRDADTLDTFVCSSWYYLRYPDNKNSENPFDTEWIDKMLPVDKYIGGAEHATMHLLYARFITKALRDLGHLHFDEPFLSLVHQGTILGPDGNKMSKSKGNVISPDTYIDQYGSDIFRLYLMFGFGYTDGGPWNDDGIKPMVKFLNRIEKIVDDIKELRKKAVNDVMEKEEKDLMYVQHYVIKKVTEDAEKFQFNTSIAKLMELLNAVNDYENKTSIRNVKVYSNVITDMIKLIAPFAPHFAEEMWEQLGYEYSVVNQEWPKYEEKYLVKDEIEIAVQMNGKLRGTIEISVNEAKEVIIEKAKESVADKLEGKTIVKEIYVPGKIVNIVVK